MEEGYFVMQQGYFGMLQGYFGMQQWYFGMFEVGKWYLILSYNIQQLLDC